MHSPAQAATETPLLRQELGGPDGWTEILEADPELALRVPPTEIADARAALRASVRSLPTGRWEVPHARHDRARLGFLLLDGILARDVIVAGSISTELVGEGDLLQPHVPRREEGLVPHRVIWHVLAPIRIAILDDAFARAVASWPQVMETLLERALSRTHRNSIHRALLQLSPVETRLLVLFWHLAERWGHVTPDGVAVRLRLPHELLGQLVGSRRASVTTALHRVSDSGLVVRRANGTWLLRGSPPNELAEVHWQQRERTAL